MMPLDANALPDPVRHAEFYADVAMKRGVAWLVDTALIAIVTLVIVPFTAFTALFYLPFLFLTVSFVYRWASLTRFSATPGMRLMAVEFRDRRGAALDAVTAFAHTLGYTICIGMVVPQVVSAGLMLINARVQGLSDLVLGTVALNRAARI